MVLRRLLGDFCRGVADDKRTLAALIVVWMSLLVLLASKSVNGLRIESYGSNFTLYLSTLVFFLIFLGGRLLLRNRPARPLAFLKAKFASERIPERLARGAPMLLALMIFLPTFSAMKSAIPLFNAFEWDAIWVDMDRSIHGTDPWRLLQPLLGFPMVTSVISLFYHLWVLLIYAGGVYFCFFQNNRELRTQFFIAYFGCWTILGIALATILASVGPCFLGPLLGNQTFAEQMEYLREVDDRYPVMVLKVQEQLVAWHRTGNHGLGRGITAMPSMHVSIAFLFFLAMRQVSKLAGLLFGIFFVIILIGSVHLAYHYAVDGYVSIVGTWVIWIVAGTLAQWTAYPSDSPEKNSEVIAAHSG